MFIIICFTVLRLLHPTSNNIAKLGEFKDKFTLTPGYNSNVAINHYEYLGLLMGIGIRTGVFLTLDLCTLVWKKLVRRLFIILLTLITFIG